MSSLSFLSTLMLMMSLQSFHSNQIAHAADLAASPTATSSPVAPVASATPLALAPITPDEKKKLPLEFKRAQSSEERAFDHQERASIKELHAAQSAALKSWRSEERKTRRKYFDEHSSGPERRQFVQGYLSRKKAFDQAQKDDLASAKRNWKSKREELKQTQKERDTQFKAAIEQNLRPAANLWPQAH